MRVPNKSTRPERGERSVVELLIHNMAPIMFGALVVLLLLGYPVAFALAFNGLFAATAMSRSLSDCRFPDAAEPNNTASNTSGNCSNVSLSCKSIELLIFSAAPDWFSSDLLRPARPLPLSGAVG